MLLRDLYKGIIGSTAGLDQTVGMELAAQAITGFVIDSREARPGTVFVALSGEHTDGLLYLVDAFSRGAVAAIAGPAVLDQQLPVAAIFIGSDGMLLRRQEAPGASDEPDAAPALPHFVFVVPDSLTALQQLAAFWRAQMPVVVIGVTGSVGKTTTKETVASVLGMRFKTLRNQGNLNNEIGLPLTLLCLTEEHERAVLEMGMYDVGEIARLSDIARPSMGIVTNVGPTHLERLGSIERIAQAKAELVWALPPEEEGGVAILNQDDPLVAAMRDQTRARVFTYGLDPTSDLWADEIVSEGMEGIGFQLHHGAQHLHVHLDMVGRHSVHTALRGAAAGLMQDMSWGEIVAGLQSERGNLRLMVVPGLRDTTLIDDTYNASPASMLAALNLLSDIANEMHRAVAVLGDMLELGSYETEGHRLVGGRASQVVDKLVTVGRRARWIAEEAIAMGMATADVYPTDSNEDAIGVLQGLIRTGDIVLVKGSRAQRMETIVDALSRPRGIVS